MSRGKKIPWSEMKPGTRPKLTEAELDAAAERGRLRRKNFEASRATVIADEAKVFEVIADAGKRALEQAASMACGGDREGISLCTPKILASCEWSESPRCPRRIIAWEQGEEMPRRTGKLESSGVPEGLFARILAPNENDATRTVRAWLAGGKLTLVLSGGVGIGKSTAGGIAILATGGSAFYLHATRFDSLKFGDSADALRARDVQLLVLDDVGLEQQGGGAFSPSNKIQGLLCDRHDRNLRTLVTCNLTPQQFCDLYQARVWSRVEGSGDFKRARGESLRAVR